MDFIPVPGGYGNQTFYCTLRSKTEEMVKEEKIVVRKSDGVTIVLSLEQEYDLLRTLNTTNFPAPKVLEIASKLPGVDGIFYTMNRIPGRMAASFVDGTTKKFSEMMLLRLAELPGQLHTIPLETFSKYISTYKETFVLRETIEQRHHRKIQSWQKYSQDVDHPPSPYVTWLFDWLKHNIPADLRRPVLTHGDFNVHNILAEGDTITGVLDWECSDFGALEMDLAYVQPTVSAHMDWNKWMDHYIAHGGQKVDPAHMVFCGAYAAMRLALAAGRFTLNLQRGINRDIRFIDVEQNLAVALMGMGLGSVAAAEGLKALQAHKSDVKQPLVAVEPKEVKGDVFREEAVHIELA